MNDRITGIHHVTAIAGSPQENVDFYTGLLGMRLVKVTVNFDDPGSYHLYYGDISGRPGTALTFFPHPGGFKGKLGSGQASGFALAVPRGSLDYWVDRLAAEAVSFAGPTVGFGERLISFADPDGLQVEIVESETADGDGWSGGEVPQVHSVRGFHSVTLLHADSSASKSTLTGDMGYTESATEGTRTRLEAATSGVGRYVDLIQVASATQGRVAVGSVHHVAFRTPDSDRQVEWRERLARSGYGVSPVMERDYFRSIYYREPGGVLFEIATDTPGFTIDEPLESLGEALKLPAWLEPNRGEIERVLPPLKLPVPAR